MEQGKEDRTVAKKVTSKSVASKASKVLRDGRTSAISKSCAASALSQREKRKKQDINGNLYPICLLYPVKQRYK